MKRVLKLLTHRVTWVILAMLLQLGFIFYTVVFFYDSYVWVYSVLLIISGIAVVGVLSDNSNPAYKLAWVVPILVFPVFGGVFYLVFGGYRPSDKAVLKMKGIDEDMSKYLVPDPEASEKISKAEPVAALQSHYMTHYARCPVYQDTLASYISCGEDKFEILLRELKKAEKYIFLEYFIIERGVFWDSVLEVLKEKAASGVDVRIIYDDFGSIMLLPYRYDKTLEGFGIKCCVFNPFVPVLSMRFNNRDHRKIVSIDGVTGFTGGINLADEYINQKDRCGHWKDTAIMLKGQAVWSLTVMFLTMWEYVSGTTGDIESYRPGPDALAGIENDGFVQPYTDNPLDGEPVGQSVYRGMLNRAQEYIYITSPYLIIDNEMVASFISAAKSGVDVRIITPHIPDKWYVHMVSRAYYVNLLEAGVKIYEYTPGFIHSKTFVSDDKYATVGTVNLDYRSMYFHFECGVWMYKTGCVGDIKADFLKTLERSQEITIQWCRSQPFLLRLIQMLLKVFAPLM